MTSNIGSHLILEYRGDGDEDSYEEMKETVLNEMRRSFRPEFLNRVDEVVVFHALTEEHLKEIVDIQLRRLHARLQERQIELVLTDDAKRHLARIAYDPVYGARPLKRALQREVETPLARLILQGEVQDNSTVVVNYEADELSFSTEPRLASVEA
jgi:ATP-dependent Clp protease ATP-binding subunit ClpB